MEVLSGPFLVAELAMRDEPDADLKCLSVRSSDPTKGVDSFRQQDGSWKSKSAKECVTTHLPNELALKMDGAEASHLESAVSVNAKR